MNRPIVSIIITTRNSSKTLTKLLQSLKEQSYNKIEIIVVDNNSEDKTRDIAKEFTRLVFNKGPERSVQRNFGASIAHGKYMLFLDSDMEMGKEVIMDCVKKMESLPLKHQVGGLVIQEKSFGSGFWVKTKALERKINEGQPYFEAARFFPKKIFQNVGGYDENLTGPEDWDLPDRVAKNYKIDRIKSYILHNEGQHTLLGLAKRKYYYGLSAHKYLSKRNLLPIGPRTVYFLRAAYYKNWKEIFKDPFLYFGMWVMLLVETLGGGLGYLMGRLKNE